VSEVTSHAPVIAEMILAPECFTADVAGEGTLISVCTLVDQQVVALGEVAPAVPTDKLLLRPGNREIEDLT